MVPRTAAMAATAKARSCERWPKMTEFVPCVVRLHISTDSRFSIVFVIYLKCEHGNNESKKLVGFLVY